MIVNHVPRGRRGIQIAIVTARYGTILWSCVVVVVVAAVQDGYLVGDASGFPYVGHVLKTSHALTARRHAIAVHGCHVDLPHAMTNGCVGRRRWIPRQTACHLHDKMYAFDGQRFGSV